MPSFPKKVSGIYYFSFLNKKAISPEEKVWGGQCFPKESGWGWLAVFEKRVMANPTHPL